MSDAIFRWTRSQRCPNCNGYQSGHATTHCWGYGSSSAFFCTKGGLRQQWVPNAQAFRHEYEDCACGRIHDGTVANLVDVDVPPPPPPNLPLFDKVLRTYVESRFLTRGHWDFLRTTRGESDLRAATDAGAVSLPDNERAGDATVKYVLDVHGADAVLQTPGFWERDGKIATHVGNAIVIPCYDGKDRMIGAVRMRVEGDGPKYMAFSGSRDLCTVVGKFKKDAQVRMAVVVDGIFKANVVHCYMPDAVIVGGSGQRLGIIGLASIMSLAPDIVVEAIDPRDKAANPQPAADVRNMLAQAGLSVYEATWGGAKGLDDLLKDGGKWQLKKAF